MRTYQDYVEDMVTRGRNLKEIRAVAMATHWRTVVDDITKHAEELLRFFGQS